MPQLSETEPAKPLLEVTVTTSVLPVDAPDVKLIAGEAAVTAMAGEADVIVTTTAGAVLVIK
jgi:hypothetical protein